MRVLFTSLFCVGVLTAVTCGAAQPSTTTMDGGASLVLYMPGNDTYDAGAAIDFQGRLWLTDNFGIAAVLGFDVWSFDEDQAEKDLAKDAGGGSWKVSADDLNLIPIGVSAVYKLSLTEGIDITAQAGLRYVIASDTEIKISEATLGSEKFDVTIDNGVVGVVGADVEVMLSDPLFLFAGAGYQFDIAKGDVKIEGMDSSDENELEAFFLRAGAGMKF
jgi:hypothetical protein